LPLQSRARDIIQDASGSDRTRSAGLETRFFRAGIDKSKLSERNLLEEDSDEEEDFFLRGPTGPRFGGQNDKIRQVQSQVDEVIDVMQENISKVIERGERLDELQDKSESLSDNASAFSSRAKQLHRRMWWRDMKIKMIIALVVVILLLVIISKSTPDTLLHAYNNLTIS
uniref:Vesicle-associated membrane protein 4 n=2 Tax=Cyprinus carpio TaxID=7962 RepID=A0A9J8APS7_CYPCA